MLAFLHASNIFWKKPILHDSLNELHLPITIVPNNSTQGFSSGPTCTKSSPMVCRFPSDRQHVLETKRQTTVIERFNRTNISYKCHIPLEETLKDKWCLHNSLNITRDAGQGKKNRETSVAQVSSEFSTVVKIQLCTAQGCFYLNGLNAAYFPLLMGRLILPS